MFKTEVTSIHHAANATQNKYSALIIQHSHIRNLNHSRILEITTNWPKSENFSLTNEEKQEMTRAKEAPPYNQLPAEETRLHSFY